MESGGVKDEENWVRKKCGRPLGDKKEREDFKYSFEALISNYLFARSKYLENSFLDCSTNLASSYHSYHYDLLKIQTGLCPHSHNPITRHEPVIP